MAPDRQRLQQYLKAFEFRTVFIEELDWDNLGYQGKARLRKALVLLSFVRIFSRSAK